MLVKSNLTQHSFYSYIVGLFQIVWLLYVNDVVLLFDLINKQTGSKQLNNVSQKTYSRNLWIWLIQLRAYNRGSSLMNFNFPRLRIYSKLVTFSNKFLPFPH